MENELGLIKKMNKNQNNFAAQEIVEKYLLHVSLRSYLHSLKRVKTIPDQVEHFSQENSKFSSVYKTKFAKVKPMKSFSLPNNETNFFNSLSLPLQKIHFFHWYKSENFTLSTLKYSEKRKTFNAFFHSEGNFFVCIRLFQISIQN